MGGAFPWVPRPRSVVEREAAVARRTNRILPRGIFAAFFVGMASLLKIDGVQKMCRGRRGSCAMGLDPAEVPGAFAPGGTPPRVRRELAPKSHLAASPRPDRPLRVDPVQLDRCPRVEHPRPGDRNLGADAERYVPAPAQRKD